MANEKDVVEFEGVLGIVLDTNHEDKLDTGVLFTDVDDDNGVFWINHNRLTKIEKGSRKYNQFMIWYKTRFPVHS